MMNEWLIDYSVFSANFNNVSTTFVYRDVYMNENSIIVSVEPMQNIGIKDNIMTW